MTLKFSMYTTDSNGRALSNVVGQRLICVAEDGKEMQLDTERMSIKDVMEEVDRHSRGLSRQADLLGN